MNESPIAVMTAPSEGTRRLDALRKYDVLDTEPEKSLDDLTELAATICEAPIASITLIDRDRQWFKSRFGIETEETPLNVSFCVHAIEEPGLFVVPDATLDDRFAANPLVTGEPHIRFYAGAPLITPDGVALGALCVIDRIPRTLTPAQEKAMGVLSRQVMSHLEAHCGRRAMKENEGIFAKAFQFSPDGVTISRLSDQTITWANEAICRLLGSPVEEVMDRPSEMYLSWLSADVRQMVDQALHDTGECLAFPMTVPGKDGLPMQLTCSCRLLTLNGEPCILSIIRDGAAERTLAASELRYRRLFESAKDGILILDAETGMVVDVNPFMISLLGFSHEEFMEKAVWDLGFFDDLFANQEKFTELREKGYVRYESLPLRTREGRNIEVEFVSNVYLADGVRVIQCNIRDVTERVRADAHLRLLETCIGRLNDIVLITEAEPQEEPGPRIVFVNDAFARRTGYSREEVLGRSPRFLQGPETSRPELDRIHEGMRKWKPVRSELLNYTKSGEKFWIELDIVPVADEKGWFTHWVAVERDVTERKRVEDELRASDERYRGLFEVTRDAIMTLEPPSWKFTSGNPAALKMFGAGSVEEFLSYDPGDASPQLQPDGRRSEEKVQEMIDRAMRDGSAEFEWTHRRIGDGEFPTDVLLTRVKQGDRVVLHATVRDMTDRKRSEARFRRLIDSNIQGVHFRKNNGAITEANDAFLNLVGYTHGDVHAGRLNWIDLTPPEYAELDQHCLDELATKGVCAPYEKIYEHKDGSRVPVLVGVAAFADNPDEGVCFVLDLTERKKLEQQFLRAQRMESIGTLAGGIAHDLNNVLSPIMMSLEILKIKFADAESQELLAILQTSAQRGSDLVQQVLSFARGVEGRRMEVQVRHIILEVEMIANDTFLKHIRMLTIVPHDLWTVVGDPTQIHQVLLNLCVNARDAMPEGGTLTISAQNITLDAHYASMSIDPEAQPGPYLFLQVKDTGTGMTPGMIDKIFDPFFTTKELGKGTGLGLSTTLSIVKSHGGFIHVYSEMGKGTTFKVYLPAHPGSSEEATAVGPIDLPRGHDELILVVDDETAVCQITQQTLEAFGYRVILAANGIEAVAVFAERSAEIAVVLTDMMMPLMDGLATIRILREINPQVRMIAASGLAAEGQVAQATSLGVRHFLAKPYTAETLLKVLQETVLPEP